MLDAFKNITGGRGKELQSQVTDLETLIAAGLDERLVNAADDDKWDGPIMESMEIACAFGGQKTQTPTIVIRDDPAHGFKGPVMAPAPTGERCAPCSPRTVSSSSRRRTSRHCPPACCAGGSPAGRRPVRSAIATTACSRPSAAAPPWPTSAGSD